MSGALEVLNVQVFYNDVIEAVRDVSLTVGKGRIVALLGANGAGKSTLLKAISAVLYPEEGRLIHGSIRYDGVDLTARNADEIVAAGIVQVPEGRRLFETMTVEENLRLGGYALAAAELGEGLERVYAMFPRVREKRHAVAGLLSGGEQQMVAIGRALMSNPRLLLCDELSLGLSPKVIRDIYLAVPRIREGGTAILLVEQDVGQAMAVADRVHCFMEGRITLSGRPADLTRARIAAAYFGSRDTGEAA